MVGCSCETLTPAIAAQYKTYPVIKVNPYGVKQKRMMGIDATRITNFKPGKEDKDRERALASEKAGEEEAPKTKKRSIYMSLRKNPGNKDNNPNTKHPMRLITDVIECEMRQGKPNCFFVRYSDKAIDYESPHADEIVAKIQVRRTAQPVFLLSKAHNCRVALQFLMGLNRKSMTIV